MKNMIKHLKNVLFKRNMESYDITMDELQKKQMQGAYIIDVRSTQEYDEGHLYGAINIPYYEINKNVDKILCDKEKEIVLYCEAGLRSKKAYKKLIKLQYTKVYSLYGGLDNWL